MKTHAIVMNRTGGFDVLEPAEIDLGALRPGFVRLQVAAVAMNRMDLWVRAGLPNIKYEFPHRLGCDISGTVIELGAGVKSPWLGQPVLVNPGVSCGACAACLSGKDSLCRDYRILGENTQGGYAAHIDVPVQNLVPAPSQWPLADLAAVPLCFLTAWQMLVDKGKVGPGKAVLIHAAGSGVSTAAIQIAKLYGATVIATSTREDKLAPAKELGADYAICSKTDDVVQRVKQLTDKRGADIVIDHVGGDMLSISLRAAAWGGKIVSCGATAAPTANIDMRHIFFRQIELLGSTMGSKASLFAIADHLKTGALKPVIGARYKLADAKQAHAQMASGELFGKVLLIP